MTIPKTAKKIELDNTTVDFFEDENFYYFDTSMTPIPEPMQNAYEGLKLIDENKKLIMINHKIPVGLFAKIEEYFDYEIEDLDDGNVKIIFSKKSNCNKQLDFDTNCQG